MSSHQSRGPLHHYRVSCITGLLIKGTLLPNLEQTPWTMSFIRLCCAWRVVSRSKFPSAWERHLGGKSHRVAVANLKAKEESACATALLKGKEDGDDGAGEVMIGRWMWKLGRRRSSSGGLRRGDVPMYRGARDGGTGPDAGADVAPISCGCFLGPFTSATNG